MRFPRYSLFVTPLVSLSLLVSGPVCAASDAPTGAKDATSVSAQAPTVAPARTSPQDLEVYPQIVRISLLEGDVRVSRGTKGAPWEAAQLNLPLEEGFSLVTGTGRAEIEFEDASTAYLGENSVLTFNTLISIGDVPRTDITLLSGTLTLDEKPRYAGELFVIHSPTEKFAVTYPSHVVARFDSYLDAMTVTPQRDLTLRLHPTASTPEDQIVEKIEKGSSVTLHNDHIALGAPQVGDARTATATAAWDTWVAQRVSERDAALTAAMRESGLTSPIPGLAELRAQGKFFPCAPYGTCWEPAGGWASKYVVDVNQLKTQGPAIQQVVNQQQSGSQLAPGGSMDLLGGFPCSPTQVQRFAQRDPLTGQLTLVSLQSGGFGSSLWAVCHAGAWINTGNHGYTWVAVQKKHHCPPVHWVKVNGKTGFVPVHPQDIVGKRPLNLEHGLFVPTGRKDSEAHLLAVESTQSVKLRADAPGRFSSPVSTVLVRADSPRLEARPLLANSNHRATAIALKPAVISFDRGSQSLQIASQVTHGTHVSTVVQHFGGTSSFASSSTSGGFSHPSSSFAGSSSASASSAHSSSATSMASASSASSASSSAHK